MGREKRIAENLVLSLDRPEPQLTNPPSFLRSDKWTALSGPFSQLDGQTQLNFDLDGQTQRHRGQERWRGVDSVAPPNPLSGNKWVV